MVPTDGSWAVFAHGLSCGCCQLPAGPEDTRSHGWHGAEELLPINLGTQLLPLDLSLRLSSPSLAFPRGSHPRKRGFPWIYFHFLFCLLVFSHLFRPGNYLHNARHWVWKRCRNMWVSCCGYFPLLKMCISLFRRHLYDEWITSIQTWIKLVDTELSFSGPGVLLKNLEGLWGHLLFWRPSVDLLPLSLCQKLLKDRQVSEGDRKECSP